MQFSSLAPVALIAGIFGSGPFLSDPCPTPRADEPVAQREFVIEAGTHDLRALLDRSAKFLNRNYIYSEADFELSPPTPVTLQTKVQINESKVEALLSQLAFTHEFIMIPLNAQQGLYEWVSLRGPRSSHVSSYANELSPDEVVKSRDRCMWVSTTYQLPEAYEISLQKQIRAYVHNLKIGPMPNLTVGAAGRSLVITGLSHEAASLIEVIRMIEADLITNDRRAKEAAGSQSADQDPPSFELAEGEHHSGIVIGTHWKAAVEKRIEALEAALPRK